MLVDLGVGFKDVGFCSALGTARKWEKENFLIWCLNSFYRRGGSTEWADAVTGKDTASTHVCPFVVCTAFLFLSVLRHVYREVLCSSCFATVTDEGVKLFMFLERELCSSY